MKISEVRKSTSRDQKILLGKIVTRRQKIAAMEAKIADVAAEIVVLQDELNMVASENIAWWDGFVPTDFEASAEGRSEMNIVPMPTVAAEKIRINSRGIFSNFDGLR